MFKQYFAVFAALVTLMGCRKEDTGNVSPDGMCVVSFRNAGQVAPSASISKSNTVLPGGSTVRVLAYKRNGEGEANLTTDVLKNTKTYVAGNGGALVPSLVDDAGGVVTGDAETMELLSGAYDFYAYSPAVKAEADNYTIKGIGHYTDFMVALAPAQSVSRSASEVELVFKHKCSKVRFNVKTVEDMENESLAADSVVLSKMASSPAADFVLGGDITPSLGTAADTCKLSRIEPSADNQSTSVWDIVLPKSSGVFDGRFFLKIQGRRYLLQAKDIPAMAFGQGVQYIFTAVVRQGDVSLVLNVASWSAVTGSVDAGAGGGAGSDSWGDGSGEAGGSVGTEHGLVIGRWENVDWEGAVGGNPDPVTGAVEIGSWKPASMLVDAGGAPVADIDTWVRKTLAVQAGGGNNGNVEDWENGSLDADMGGGDVQIMPANCYLLVPGESVTFDPRIQGNGGVGAVAMDPKSVQVLWQDGQSIIQSVAFENGMATVTANRTAGNAVVAAYSGENGTGDILWSWHIWVTDYQPWAAGLATRTANAAYDVPGGQVHTYGTEFQKVNGLSRVIMDRNLGATKTYYMAPAAATTAAAQDEIDKSFGMFYEWGRKDPFPWAKGSTINVTTGDATTIPIYGKDGITVLLENSTGYRKVNITGAGVISGTNTLAYAVKNPLTFIYNGSGLYDWYTNAAENQNNDLWSDAVKSIYDPCPAGWRVPKNGTWSDFTRTDANTGTFLYWEQGVQSVAAKYYATNGCLYIPAGTSTKLTWYPAQGARRNSTGVLGAVGCYGYSWSSSVISVKSISLGFYTQGIEYGASGRSYGYPVRCIQE